VVPKQFNANTGCESASFDSQHTDTILPAADVQKGCDISFTPQEWLGARLLNAFDLCSNANLMGSQTSCRMILAQSLASQLIGLGHGLAHRQQHPAPQGID
jgi:hypothetical protein